MRNWLILISRFKRGRYLQKLVLDNIIWILLLLSCIIFSFTVPRFFSIMNFRNILLSATGLGILVIAESIVLLTGNFDLSVESTLGFTAIIAAWLMVPSGLTSGLSLNPVLAIFLMVLIGAGIGLFNGFFIVKLKMNAFIVTIAMLIIIRAAALNVTKAHIVIGLPEGYVSIAKIGIGSFPLMIFIFLFLYILFHIILKYTRFGRSVYAIGDNIDAAYASGINTDKIIIITFVIAGVLSAIVGWVLAARFRSVAPGLGEGMIFDTVAAAVIGGVSLRGGIGKVSGIFGGVLLLTIIGNILNLLEFSPFHINMIRGGVVFVAVLIDSLKYRREV